MASSWVVPRTWVTAEIPPASTFNIHVRDNLSWLGNDAPACRVRKNSNQSIATASDVPITFATGDNTEDTDPQAMHNPAVNDSRITIPAGMGGLYAVGGNVEWAGNATGARQTSIRLNGSSFLVREQTAVNSVSAGTDQSVSTIYRLAATDYIELLVLQNSGGNLNVTFVSPRSPCLWAYYIRN